MKKSAEKQDGEHPRHEIEHIQQSGSHGDGDGDAHDDCHEESPHDHEGDYGEDRRPVETWFAAHDDLANRPQYRFCRRIEAPLDRVLAEGACGGHEQAKPEGQHVDVDDKLDQSHVGSCSLTG